MNASIQLIHANLKSYALTLIAIIGLNVSAFASWDEGVAAFTKQPASDFSRVYTGIIFLSTLPVKNGWPESPAFNILPPAASKNPVCRWGTFA